MRFGIEAATGGDSYRTSGSVMVTNVSSRTCQMNNDPILRWRQAGGTVLPVKVTGRAPVVPLPLYFVIRPGERGSAGLRWQKYKALDSTETCPPFAATLDIWLGATLVDPHPERRSPVSVPWFTGTTASICGGTMQLSAFQRML